MHGIGKIKAPQFILFHKIISDEYNLISFCFNETKYDCNKLIPINIMNSKTEKLSDILGKILHKTHIGFRNALG